jgi:hypothetical protein
MIVNHHLHGYLEAGQVTRGREKVMGLATLGILEEGLLSWGHYQIFLIELLHGVLLVKALAIMRKDALAHTPREQVEADAIFASREVGVV